MKDQTTQGNIREIIFKDNFYFRLPFSFFFKTNKGTCFYIYQCDFKVTFFFPQFHPFT